MRIYITGARGFLGRHLALSQSARSDVYGLGHGNWPPEYALQSGVKGWLESDITFRSLDHLAGKYGKPEVIFHTAGGSSVGPSLADPLADFQKSVTATATLCDWVRRYSPETAVVLTSSAAVYGAGHSAAIRESAELRPFSPYGFHKRMAELILGSYSQSYGIRTAIVRLFSVYGPELRKQLIWDLCEKLRARSRVVTLNGTGAEIRDWLHVSDAVSLLERAAADASPSCLILNGGSGIGITVARVADIVREYWDPEVVLAFSGICRSGDPQCLLADTEAACSLGFRPEMELRAGLSNYVAWYKRMMMST